MAVPDDPARRACPGLPRDPLAPHRRQPPLDRHRRRRRGTGRRLRGHLGRTSRRTEAVRRHHRGPTHAGRARAANRRAAGTAEHWSAAIYEYHAVVRSIHDGDTGRFDISCGFGVWIKDQPLRFAGIDAPELGTDAGRAARDFVRARLPVGTDVWVRTHKDADDKYGRLLADIYLSTDDLFHNAGSVNEQLVNAGLATPYFGGAR